MRTIQDIKLIPIRDYLAQRGVRPKQENNRYGFYLSPLREEGDASFKVDYSQNMWYDFGLGRGGSIIDLVMEVEKCNFQQAVERLQSSNIVPSNIVTSQTLHILPSSLQVVGDYPLRHPALINYLDSRAIDTAIAKKICREVHYSVGEHNYFAIGFRNDYGGWELRSERFKGCSTPKHITTIDNGSDKALVFEGFMDFLSYLTIKRNDSPTCNIAVLNSVANVQKAVPFLARHRSIYTFLDNDDAGRKALSEIERLCPRSEVVNQSDFYRRHKDLNDYLRSQQPRKRVVAKHRRGMKL
ncbi:MAG: toprim domain-containing protein [Alphaproteobacteria bacterium]|nr:toprim domain-containing protein [Alphaproteobacteria bacterium]MBQ3605360.1 toprim domain-containing protein [Muribaculaceae bacterium]